MKKTFALLVAFALLIICFTMMPIRANASTITEINTAADRRFYETMEDQVNEMVEWYNIQSDESDISLQIVYATELYDFDGNLYTLVECRPAGYMIYHNESGVFVEYSPVTNSPFWGLGGEWRYAGPNEYYVCDEGASEYRYVFDNKNLTAAEMESLVGTSELVNETLLENKNDVVLDYIAGTSDVSLQEYYEDRKEATPMTVTSDGWTYVNNYRFFENLNNCGYIDGGKCGYIAAGMLLAYDKAMNSKNTIDSSDYSYNSSTGKYSIDTSLPTDLYNKGVSLGYGASTTSVAIHYTVKAWLADRGLSVTHTSLYVPLANHDGIIAHLDVNRPVIWFGAVTANTAQPDNNSTHAIVIYGYQHYDNYYNFVAHFGWNNATHVYFAGVLGSMYAYQW